jgi:hypothetical protein
MPADYIYDSAIGHQREDACHSDRLTHRGAPELQADARDTVPHNQPHRPVLMRAERVPEEPEAGGRVSFFRSYATAAVVLLTSA